MSWVVWNTGLIHQTVVELFAKVDLAIPGRPRRSSFPRPRPIPLKIGLELRLSNLLSAVEYLLDPSDRCRVIRETDLVIPGS